MDKSTISMAIFSRATLAQKNWEPGALHLLQHWSHHGRAGSTLHGGADYDQCAGCDPVAGAVHSVRTSFSPIIWTLLDGWSMMILHSWCMLMLSSKSMTSHWAWPNLQHLGPHSHRMVSSILWHACVFFYIWSLKSFILTRPISGQVASGVQTPLRYVGGYAGLSVSFLCPMILLIRCREILNLRRDNDVARPLKSPFANRMGYTAVTSLYIFALYMVTKRLFFSSWLRK